MTSSDLEWVGEGKARRLYFVDAEWKLRWRIYDRWRNRDGRAYVATPHRPGARERVFVSETGIHRVYTFLESDEPKRLTEMALQLQLRRARVSRPRRDTKPQKWTANPEVKAAQALEVLARAGHPREPRTRRS